MVGIWSIHNNIFLFVAGVAMLISFGIPLMLAPVSWAHVFRWEIPQPSESGNLLWALYGGIYYNYCDICIQSNADPGSKTILF